MAAPHLSKSKNGIYRYRRAVPEDLRAILGIREIKKSLGSDFTVAMRRYAEVHRAAEKALANCRLTTPPSVREEVLAILRRNRVSDADIDRIADGLDFERPEDLDLMNGMDALQAELIDDYEDAEQRSVRPQASLEAIRAIGAPRLPPHTYTLSGALDFYLKAKERPEEFRNKQLQSRIVDLKKRMTAAIGHHAVVKRPLENFAREDARKVVDHLASEGLAPGSIRRMIGIANAACAMTILEFDLKAKNQFSKLQIKGADESARAKRLPFTEEDMKVLDPVMIRDRADPLSVAWVLARDTGARPEEIWRRKVSDVDLKRECISIPFGKTANSIRIVPLSPAAVAMISPLIAGQPPSAFLFPKYGEARGADYASRAIMKRIRTVIEEPKKVFKSLRHRMADRLRDTGCPEDIREEIQGWSQQRSSKIYGVGHALEVKRQYLGNVWRNNTGYE